MLSLQMKLDSIIKADLWKCNNSHKFLIADKLRVENNNQVAAVIVIFTIIMRMWFEYKGY